jgi:DeoR/GlpR family transcriptional regulator of sugar metabolism
MIAALAAEKGHVSVSDLAARLGVSEMTIRRDLEALESDKLLIRVRGGAYTGAGRSYEPPFVLRATHDVDAKQRIGVAAAELLAEGETAIVDVGTTALELARALRGRDGLLVITPSLLAASELAREAGIRTHVTGGMIRHEELSLVGPTAQEAFSMFNCDVAFVGVAGVHAERGLTEYSLADAYVKRSMVAAARRVVVLADASKLGRIALATVAPLGRVDVIVSDAPPDHPVLSAAAAAGVHLVHASEASR